MDTRSDVVKNAIKKAEPVKQQLTDIPSLSLETKRVQKTASLPSGESETVEWTPPTGEMWDLYHFFFKVNSDGDATSGTHRLDVYLKTNTNEHKLLRGRSTYSGQVWFQYGVWFKADDQQLPNNVVAQGLIIKRVCVFPFQFITLEYNNNTDVPQENTRTYAAHFKKFQI